MNMFPNAKILLIGAGKMGGALQASWLRAGAIPDMITIVEPKGFAGGPRIHESIDDVSVTQDCIVLAVKPQSMDALLPSLAKKFGRDPLYFSIAAGKTLVYYAKYLGEAPIVRAMPNTPAIIGKGISALIANGKVTASQKQLAESLLGAAGETVWLDNESQMDAVTALSGSGPAYVFLFLEALIEAGKAQGLPEEMAKKLAYATVRGSVKLAKKSENSLEQLRKNVTSPGGTTEAALNVLMKGDALKELVDEAVAAAVKRSRELA
jgi:pyrroline-5-carboxylate reductase